MTGRRIATAPEDIPVAIMNRMQPGDYAYCKMMNAWLCITPNGIHGNLRNHTITEHPDGTISVTPSILCKGYIEGGPPGLNTEYHGYLVAGVWNP